MFRSVNCIEFKFLNICLKSLFVIVDYFFFDCVSWLFNHLILIYFLGMKMFNTAMHLN